MNEGVPFFASLMATTIHKMGEKNFESVGKLEALESFKRKKTKDKMGRGSGKVVASPKGNGALKKKNYNFFHLFLTKKKPNHPNIIRVMFHPKIRNPN